MSWPSTDAQLKTYCLGCQAGAVTSTDGGSWAAPAEILCQPPTENDRVPISQDVSATVQSITSEETLTSRETLNRIRQLGRGGCELRAVSDASSISTVSSFMLEEPGSLSQRTDMGAIEESLSAIHPLQYATLS
jgi:hypothetical protein